MGVAPFELFPEKPRGIHQRTDLRLRLRPLFLASPPQQPLWLTRHTLEQNGLSGRKQLVILARFDPANLSEETRGRAAEGVVAYSAVCTHQACPVNMWSKERDAFVCSCHGSVYDPRNGAEVMAGPAPRPLPSLGLKIAGGNLTVASGFSGRVGGTQK